MSGGAGWGDLQEEGAGEEEKGGKCCESEHGAGFLVLSQHLGVVLHYANFASFLAQKQWHTYITAVPCEATLAWLFSFPRMNEHITKN